MGFEEVWLSASVALMVNVNVPTADVFPLNAPVDALKLTPVGSVPLCERLIGLSPPVVLQLPE
jgi:hypothetical protein